MTEKRTMTENRSSRLLRQTGRWDGWKDEEGTTRRRKEKTT